jgi:hypothetical protein
VRVPPDRLTRVRVDVKLREAGARYVQPNLVASLEHVARWLGISRTPVREAIRRRDVNAAMLLAHEHRARVRQESIALLEANLPDVVIA